MAHFIDLLHTARGWRRSKAIIEVQWANCVGRSNASVTMGSASTAWNFDRTRAAAIKCERMESSMYFFFSLFSHDEVWL